jgi:hypothetical protein
MDKPSNAIESLEEQYLIQDQRCSTPPNCCAECLWFYCWADSCGCVTGLMLQQLLNNDKPDPMSQENAGDWAKLYCVDGCYDFFFPCVLTDGFSSSQNAGIGNNNESERALEKHIQNERRQGIAYELVRRVAPNMEHINERLHRSRGCCASLHRTGYVIKKNEENKKNDTEKSNEEDASSPFISSFHHPPGVKEIEFLIQ